jgi:GAF domain-containing protein
MSLENLTPSIQPGTPPRIGKQDKEEVLHSVLLGSAFIGLIVYFIKVFNTIQTQDWFQTILYSALFLFLILLALLRRLPYSLKLYTFLLILFVMGVSSLYFNGIVSDGFVYLLSFSIILAVFTNIRFSVIGILISIVTIGVFSFAMVSGIIPSPTKVFISNSRNLLDWLSAGLVFLLAEMVAVIAVALTIQKLDRVAREQTKYADELENERATLDQRIQDRTQDLQKKATQLQVASQVARNIALQDNPEEFLSTAVNLIRDQFGFYHSGIFLLDDKREFALLKAATGEAGKEMLESEHRLKVGEEGIVGYVVDRGEARIALDVGQDSVHFRNPLLPGTRSEMALPLKIGDKIIGALDVQSELESAFTLEDINILQVIADQLAVALERSRLVNDLQSSLQQFRTGVREYTQRGWAQYINKIRGKSAYKYSSTGLTTKVIDSPIMREVTEKGETIIRINENDTRAPAILAVPVKLREQTIGVVEMKISDTTVVETLQNMMESTATRLALALENARLIDEMQTRADQEHMITNITGKIRTSTAVNDILKMTAVELGKSMGVSEVRVELRTKSQEITDEQYLQEKLP